MDTYTRTQQQSAVGPPGIGTAVEALVIPRFNEANSVADPLIFRYPNGGRSLLRLV